MNEYKICQQEKMCCNVISHGPEGALGVFSMFRYLTDIGEVYSCWNNQDSIVISSWWVFLRKLEY